MSNTDRHIYKQDGSILTDSNGKAAEWLTLEYSGEWMGTCNVTVSLKNEAPILFSIGDYLIYRGERFEINYEPGKIKSEAKDWNGESFKYSSVVFNSLADELVRSEFLDVVLEDNNIHYTALPQFAFYIDSLDGIADRLQANMDEQYGKGKWHFYTRNKKACHDRGCDDAVWDKEYGEGIADNKIDSTSISISSQSCWDVLSLVNSQFDVNFIVRGRDVFIGTAGITVGHIFKHGNGEGLYEIEETADSNQSVITRIKAYGNTTNLPTRYYAEVGARCAAKVKKVNSKLCDSLTEPMGCEFVLDMNYADSMNAFTRPRPEYVDQYGNTQKWPGWYIVKVTFDDITEEEIYVRKSAWDEVKDVVAATQWFEPTDLAARENQMKFIKAVEEGKTMYFTDGVKRSKMPSKNIVYTSDLPNNMAIDRLMLPGFPNMSLQQWWNNLTAKAEGGDESAKARLVRLNPTGAKLRFSEDQYRPYVESPNAGKIGVRPSSVYFDSDNEKEGLKDIYPTIEEMEVGGVRIDEIDTGTEESITDDGVFKDGQTVPNFNIWLKKEIDFDIKTLANDDFQINMKDGMCGGRSFKVAAIAKDSNGRWRLRLERALDSDLSLYFPYKDFPIKKGDKFVLTGLDMPESYVSANSEELLRYAIAKLLDNDYTRKTYTPKVDEIFMARQNDAAEADETGSTVSLYQTIKEGSLMIFKDEDLGVDTRMTIDKLNIKEQDGKIPTYDVTLKDEKEVGTIKKIQNQVSSIISGSYGEGGFTNSQIEGMITAVCKDLYLSKTSKDTARAIITFLKGLKIGTEYSISETGDATLRSLALGDYGIAEDGDATLRELASGDFSGTAQTGYAVGRREDGKYKMSLTDLEVWGKAIFHELEIRKLSYVGGNYIFSPAGCTLQTVNSQMTGVVRCFFMAEDDEKKSGNMWRVGDLALCEEFDTDKQTAGNRRYWRKVVTVSTEASRMHDADGNTLYDGRKFHFIDLSVTDCEQGSDMPHAGDAICCLGNATDKERQNAIQIQTIGDMAPAIIQYDGVNTYSLQDKDKTVVSPKGNKFIGEFYTKAGGASLATSIDGLSLKMDAQSREDRNLVPDSRLRLHSSGYGVGIRDVVLEQDTAYTMSARGTTDQKLTDGGGVLAVFAYNDDWSWTKTLKLRSTATGMDEQSVTFSDVPRKGVYHVAAYAYHEAETSGYGNMKPQEDGTFTLDYIQIEKGSAATSWTPNEEDAAVSGNLLRRIDEAGWTIAAGTEMQQDAFVADGRHTAVAHLRNNADNVAFMLTTQTDVEGDSVYVVSLWAKGTGTFTTHLYPDSITYAEDNQGHSSNIPDGTIENTLTDEWRKYTFRLSTKRKAQNMLTDAAFRNGLSSWQAVGTWAVDNDSIDGEAAARLVSLSGGYGEIVQTVPGIAKGARYTVQLNVIGTVQVYLMSVTPSDVYVDGVKTTPTDGYRISLPAASNWTEHTITFVANESSDMVLRLRSYSVGARVGKPMVSLGHLKSAWRSKEASGETLIPVRLGARSEIWVAAVKMEKNWRATEYTERTLTAAELLPAGLDILGNKIIATADNFEVRNQEGEVTTTVTADGQLTAGILSTKNRGEGYLRAEDGMMEVYNADGLKNIRFGLDKNSGMMVLEYYNNQGVLMYNLGPGGLTNKGLQTASLAEYMSEHAGTFFNNMVRYPGGGGTYYEDRVYEFADDGCLELMSKFKSQLVPTPSTTAGYEPVSKLGEYKSIYYYQAARVQTAYVIDPDNGIATEALAREADEKWFDKKPICEDGALHLMSSDTQILKGEKLHWGTRENGLQQLAIYMYEYDEGVRDRIEVFIP